MKQKDIILTEAMREELRILKHRPVNLNDPDAPEIVSWKNAVIGKFYRPIKRQVTIRFDSDILDWFKRNASHYQTLMNVACRKYMMRHQKIKKITKIR